MKPISIMVKTAPTFNASLFKEAFSAAVDNMPKDYSDADKLRAGIALALITLEHQGITPASLRALEDFTKGLWV